MKSNNIIIVPSTHWDREWYLPFNEYRANLINMLDKLIAIFEHDPDFKNFTLDGQTIPVEDYLDARPENEKQIEKFVKEGRLSIGPFYVLPDEFLISGESLIRNLMLGHKVAKRFGRVMKAGYIPDPFGHITQLPQILSEFEIPSCFFARGFGNEFDNLNMEFTWNAPGNAAAVMGIHLVVGGYCSAANLKTTIRDGKYRLAINHIGRIIKKLEKYTTTEMNLLVNGCDHLFPQPELTKIVQQWNQEYPEQKLEINDFEYYINKILEKKPELKSYQGELRGGKYNPILSGVFSARMWIKQQNTEIEYLYEKYTEPISTITGFLDKYNKFKYPLGYIWTGLRLLLQNQPHDSICGCSIDEVHEEMKTRFQWSKQIAYEILKNSFLYLSDLIKIDTQNGKREALIVYNPLPWKRKDVVHFNIISNTNFKEDITKYPNKIKVIDSNGNEIEHQNIKIEEIPRYKQETNSTFKFSFIAELPALGYHVYYICPAKEMNEFSKDFDNFKMEKNLIENEFYRINIKPDGHIDVYNKESNLLYENICQFEDMGDWGDEYDFSGPRKGTDKIFHTVDAYYVDINPLLDGPSQKTVKINYEFDLPISLSKDRANRDEKIAKNEIKLFVSLYKGIKRIDFKIELENNSKDHRIRVLFPTKIKSDKVYADGHFYIVPREINLPNDNEWVQKALPTNHEKDFVCTYNEHTCFAIFNRGLPEYEALKENDGSITLAITLLRCIEWLSRADLVTRGGYAGPDLNTPGAQCIGNHAFELAIVIENKKGDYLDSEIQVIGKEFNNPSLSFIPSTVKASIRRHDTLNLNPVSVLEALRRLSVKEIEPYLPPVLSFLENDNKKIMLSSLKQSETGKYLIVRVYNLSPKTESCNLKFYDGLSINSVKVVNLLEEEPNNKIKANAKLIKQHIVNLNLDPHVIATIRLEFTSKYLSYSP